MIRPYKKADAEKLTDIWLAASLQAHDFINESYWRSKTEEIRTVWLPAAKTLVWEENGAAIAFVALLEKEYIGALFVEPVLQKCGIGSRLLSALQKEYPLLRLRVFAKNDNAVQFYLRRGFKVDGQQKDNATGEEELLMVWKKEVELNNENDTYFIGSACSYYLGD